jgi:hypothetical protein
MYDNETLSIIRKIKTGRYLWDSKEKVFRKEKRNEGYTFMKSSEL